MSFFGVLGDIGKKALVGYVNFCHDIYGLLLGGCQECGCKKYINDPFGIIDHEGFQFDCFCGHGSSVHNFPFQWYTLYFYN